MLDLLGLHQTFSWPVVLTHVMLMVGLGMALEVVFTAIMDFPKSGNLRLMGYTYIWMIPIYCVVYPGCWLLYPHLSQWPFPARGLLYVAIIYVVEYASGWLLKKTTGACPWDYTGAKWAVHGLIRLDYAPAWFGASLTYEWVYRVLRGYVS